MNKNLLIKQNNELFDKIKILKNQNARLTSQIADLKTEICDYKAKISAFESEIQLLKNPVNKEIITDNIDLIIKTAPETTNSTNSVELSDEFNFASDTIGNIVIKAAGFINNLTDSSKINKKELINLILGRTEIAKAEILNIVTSEVSFSAKKGLISTQYDEALEYFKSIIEQ